jgi:hypothetical protein
MTLIVFERRVIFILFLGRYTKVFTARTRTKTGIDFAADVPIFHVVMRKRKQRIGFQMREKLDR